jgi:hypothetical protein
MQDTLIHVGQKLVRLLEAFRELLQEEAKSNQEPLLVLGGMGLLPLFLPGTSSEHKQAATTMPNHILISKSAIVAESDLPNTTSV